MPRNPREWIAVLWPAFVCACMLEVVVFAGFDPHDFSLLGIRFEGGDAVYSIAFFAFWAICTAMGVVVWSLSRSSEEINRYRRHAPVTLPLPARWRKAALPALVFLVFAAGFTGFPAFPLFAGFFVFLFAATHVLVLWPDLAPRIEKYQHPRPPRA